MRSAAALVLALTLACSSSGDVGPEETEQESASGSGASGSGAAGGGGGSDTSGSSSAGAAGPASSSSSASTGGGPTTFHMEDTLQGSTQGNTVGGSIGPDGWTVTDRTDRLWWALPRLVEGSVEFTITNATLSNLTVNDNEILALYDGGFGIPEPINYNPEYRNNNFKAMVRIYGTNEPDRTGLQKIIWAMCPGGAPGYSGGDCPCSTNYVEEPFGGDPNWDGSPQVLRVEWGNGATRLFRNGGEVHALDWSGTGIAFGPNELHLSLGTSRATGVDTAGMPVGAVFSNVVVDGVTGPETPACN